MHERCDITGTDKPMDHLSAALPVGQVTHLVIQIIEMALISSDRTKVVKS